MIVRLKDSVPKKNARKRVGFNSMIVRLKGRKSCETGRENGLFQFYDSPIKRHPYCKECKKYMYSFNSMIVRLKAVRNDKKHY